MAVVSPEAWASSTSVSVHPTTSNVDAGETFKVNVTITEVTNLTGWEFKLFYLNQIVNCTRVTEGPFLKQAGSTFKIFDITDDYNATHGRILAGCTLLGQDVSASGSGTLATITFEAITGGQTPLHLIDTKLGDEKIPPQPIPHVAFGGVVNVGAIHDLAVLDLTLSKTAVGQGYTLTINTTIENQGGFTETFNVTVHANSTALETQELVDLGPTARTTASFKWNTTGSSYGNYSIMVYAWPAAGETDIADNTLTEGWVLVTIPGDVDGDKDVDIYDIVRMAGVYGVRKPDPQYDPYADIDDDGDIDIYDIVIAAGNYGKLSP